MLLQRSESGRRDGQFLNKREGVDFQFGRFGGDRMICPAEDDVVYYTAGLDIVVIYDV